MFCASTASISVAVLASTCSAAWAQQLPADANATKAAASAPPTAPSQAANAQPALPTLHGAGQEANDTPPELAPAADFLQGARGNTTVASFSHAKAHLAVLYSERPRTLYSDCAYDAERRIDYDQCRYRPHKQSERAHRIEWEHVVPAEAFGQAFACWREGHPSCIDAQGRAYRGRRCAQRASAEFRRMEADMYNLFPEIGEVNQLRSNKPMGEPTRNRRALSSLSASAVGSDAFLPRPEVRGDVARTYRYMEDSYPGHGIVGRKRDKLFSAWDAADPVDAWECRRAWRIEAIQGNENPFVKTPCLEAGLWPTGG